MQSDLRWTLLYTKRHAEAWAEINLRKQGFSTLLPRVRGRGGLCPLFPRYVFVGYGDERAVSAMQHTFGVLYTVLCGDKPARVPNEVIAEICDRMDGAGIVTLDSGREQRDLLFASQRRERIRTLEKFAQAGFKVRAA